MNSPATSGLSGKTLLRHGPQQIDCKHYWAAQINLKHSWAKHEAVIA